MDLIQVYGIEHDTPKKLRLGPFAAVLPCLHLDKPPLEQQNTKKLQRTKNNLHAKLGQIVDKIQRDQGTSLVVQSLRIHLAMQGLIIQSLIGELRSHVS